MNKENVQLGNVIKSEAIGKKLSFGGAKVEFDTNSIYIKIGSEEISIPYEIEIS